MTPRWRRVKNRLSLWLHRPTPRHIVALTYAMTYRCNSRCRHCGTWQHGTNRAAPAQSELTTQDVDAIWTANAAHFTQLQSLHLTGGEPFLREDLSEICSQALRRFPKARVHISTNGLDGDRIIGALSRIPDPRRVCLAFSLDGPAEVYQAIRGVDRFAEVQESLQRVRCALPQIELGVNVTIVPENVSHLETIYASAKSVGAGFGMQVAHTSAYYHNRGLDVSCRPDDLHQVDRMAEKIVREYREVHGLLKSLVDVEPSYFAHLTDRAVSALPRPIEEPCFSGTHSLFLDPYGYVFPCVMLSAPMGRLPQQTLRDFWHSAGARGARQDIAQGACQCWTSCEAFPSLARDIRVIFWNLRTLWRH